MRSMLIACLILLACVPCFAADAPGPTAAGTVPPADPPTKPSTKTAAAVPADRKRNGKPAADQADQPETLSEAMNLIADERRKNHDPAVGSGAELQGMALARFPHLAGKP